VRKMMIGIVMKEAGGNNDNDGLAVGDTDGDSYGNDDDFDDCNQYDDDGNSD
jgi:hypothetical protein